MLNRKKTLAESGFSGGHPDDEMLQMYADGAIARESGQQIAAHLKTCAVCAAAAAQYESLNEMLRQTPLIEPSAVFDARLAEGIAASLREKRRSRLAVLRANYLAWLAAACIIAVLAAAAIAGGDAGSPKEPAGITALATEQFNLFLGEITSAFRSISPVKSIAGYVLLLLSLAGLGALDRALRQKLL